MWRYRYIFRGLWGTREGGTPETCPSKVLGVKRRKSTQGDDRLRMNRKSEGKYVVKEDFYNGLGVQG